MLKKLVKSTFLKYNKLSSAHFSILQRMNIALSKGILSQSIRNFDKNDPQSWEFSGFSQNGEDGIVQHLTANIINPDRYFIEIGSSDGLENNSAFLAFVLKFSGVMIEGDDYKSAIARECLQRFNWGVEYVNSFVSRENIGALLDSRSATKTPDFFSLDIDGNDYYLLEVLLKQGYKPKIICVEYNSVYGPDAAITIKYDPEFNYWTAHDTHWYYGVSVSAWKKLLGSYGYEFLTVDKNGVNAFFIDPAAFPSGFTSSFRKVDFGENFAIFNRTKTTWEKQFEKISHLEYYTVE